MISVILYGRNDSHGYNLHKRAAISLNAIAEVLNDKDDEILFVDYNTPDDLPSFIEALEDTLTDKTLKLLRVLRVRNALHHKIYQNRTTLVAIEPLARNIAIRRSNPNNKWILSTNTDMVFIPRAPHLSLNTILEDLEDGFYALPRFEIPERLWESFDRKDPAQIIQDIGDLGRRMYLNETVYGIDEILYDAPGDFQLLPRKDYFALSGFHEDMILGWHVDSNLSRRVRLYGYKIQSLVQHVFGYHCDHTRQSTIMHRHNRTQNSIETYITHVKSPYVLKQAETWGLPDENIEEITLQRQSKKHYIDLLLNILPEPTLPCSDSSLINQTYNRLYYQVEHIIPYLVDHIISSPLSSNIAFIGSCKKTFSYFYECWSKLQFTGKLFIPSDVASFLVAPASENIIVTSKKEVFSKSCLFIFNFATEECTDIKNSDLFLKDLSPATHAALHTIAEIFNDFAKKELSVLYKKQPLHKFICINAIHNNFESITHKKINTTITPYNTRIRHGYVKSVQEQKQYKKQRLVTFPVRAAKKLVRILKILRKI